MARLGDIRDSVEASRIVGAILDAYGTGVPLSVILFGSRARGDSREGSDWDAFVMLPDGWEKPGGFWSDPVLAAEESSRDLPLQVVASTRAKLATGQTWSLFRRILDEGITLYGRDASGYGFPPGMALLGASHVLGFAAGRLSSATWFVSDGESSGDGFRRDTRMALAAEEAGTALARAFDAWACSAGSLGPCSKLLPGSPGELAAGCGMPDGLAGPMGLAARAVATVSGGWEQGEGDGVDPAAARGAVLAVAGFLEAVATHVPGLPTETAGAVADAVAESRAIAG